MKRVILLALVSIVMLAGCNKSENVNPTAPVMPKLGASTLNNSMNGSAGIELIYYDGNLFKMGINPFSTQSAASLLAHNKSINILYESDGFITVTNAIQGGGPGYNALWQEVDIVFNPGFPPHQFLSDNDILPASMGSNPEITLVPTNEIYRCNIVEHTKVQ